MFNFEGFVFITYLVGFYTFFRFIKCLHENEIENEKDPVKDSVKEPVKDLVKDPVKEYLDKNKKIFDTLLLDISRNMNIEDPEEKWQRRIIMETTPLGNVIMYYDLYRNAFAYFCDQQISYSILNACAMKYVRIYRCFDFFVDMNVLPKGVISSLILNIEKEEKEEKQKQEEKKKKLGINFKNAPFVKIKSCKPTSIIYKNTFRNLGKTVNFSPLQFPKIQKEYQNTYQSYKELKFIYL